MEENQEKSIKNNKKKEKLPVLTVKANKKGQHVMVLMNVLRVVLLPIFYILKPFRTFGHRKVKDGACIYIGNHYTIFDPVYMAITTWEGVHFIGKRENFEAPVLGSFMRWVKAIKVNRDGNDVRALLDGLKCLKNNEKIALFPEGTRNKTSEELLPFRHGAALMAIRAKVPIIPVVIYDRPKFFKCAHIIYGEPIELTEYYDKKVTEQDYQAADEKLRARILDIKREHKEFLENKKKGKKR